MATTSADQLVSLAVTKLRTLLKASSKSSLEAFVLAEGKHHYAVKVSQVAQRPVPVFHLTVFDKDGVFKTAAMVTEGMIAAINDAAATGQTRKSSA